MGKRARCFRFIGAPQNFLNLLFKIGFFSGGMGFLGKFFRSWRSKEKQDVFTQKRFGNGNKNKKISQGFFFFLSLWVGGKGGTFWVWFGGLPIKKKNFGYCGEQELRAHRTGGK